MENFNNDTQLDKLHAGREFADYMVINGWNIIELYAGDTSRITFLKGNKKIEYIADDNTSMFTTFIKPVELKGWYQLSHVSSGDLEADVLKFSFMAHALNWVDMKTAIKNFRTEFEHS